MTLITKGCAGGGPVDIATGKALARIVPSSWRDGCELFNRGGATHVRLYEPTAITVSADGMTAFVTSRGRSTEDVMRRGSGGRADGQQRRTAALSSRLGPATWLPYYTGPQTSPVRVDDHDQRNLLCRAAGSRGRLAATGSTPPYYRTEQAGTPVLLLPRPEVR
jgi:hypothetical protein